MSSKSVVLLWRYCNFWIFKMAPAAILDFWNREILLAIWVARVETHQHAKLCQNRSIGREDIKIFRLFKMAAAAILHCRIHKIYWLDGPYASFYQISSKSVNQLRRYSDFSTFQHGGRRHLGFLKSQNFIGYWGPQGGDASVRQISSKSVNRLRRY